MTIKKTNMYTRKITCEANKPDSPIQTARKTFEKKRQITLKENINKLVTIATADTKELNEFLKELDVLHKKELMPNSVKTAESSESEESENIFLKQE
jgi:hypothetical protein